MAPNDPSADLPWLDDHRVPPYVLHPGAAHIVIAILAAEQAYNEFPDALPFTGITLRNVTIKKTLVVPEDDHGIEIVLSIELEDGATAKSPVWASFSTSSVVRDTEQWTEHCSGLAKVEVLHLNKVLQSTRPWTSELWMQKPGTNALPKWAFNLGHRSRAAQTFVRIRSRTWPRPSWP